MLSSSVATLPALRIVGVPIALLGAACLSVGAQLQSRGVRAGKRVASTSTGLSLQNVIALLRQPAWLLGTLLLGLAVGLQLASLRFAPLIVVQPLGVVALVVSALLNARVTRIRVTRATVRAITLCVGGVAVFVGFAAPFSSDPTVPDQSLVVILGILLAVLVTFAGLFALLRRRVQPLVYIIGAGVLYGFVASTAKTVISRVSQGSTDGLTVLGGLALLVAGAAGLYLVQTAYAVGSPDQVIAGLTVIDPLVAVSIGIGVLREAADAPVWTMPILAAGAATAVVGVFRLARHQAKQIET